MRYVELSADQNGDTHFSDRDLELTIERYEASAPPVPIRELTGATRLVVISFPAGLADEVLHAAPSLQWAVVTSGELEIGTSLGDRRLFAAGSVINIRDLGSAGHSTRVIGDAAAELMVVEYDEDLTPNATPAD